MKPVVISMFFVACVCLPSVSAVNSQEITQTITSDQIINDLKVGRDVKYNNVRISGELDFTSLPYVDNVIEITNSEFLSPIKSHKIIFKSQLLFINNDFNEPVIFDGSIFENTSIFTSTRFKSAANFNEVIFKEGVRFVDNTFALSAEFVGMECDKLCLFTNVEFHSDANFFDAVFVSLSQFTQTQFLEDANFEEAEFGGEVNFDAGVFGGKSSFRVAKFGDVASFQDASFRDRLYFTEASFSKELDLDDINAEEIDLIGTEFLPGSSLKLLRAEYNVLRVRNFDFSILPFNSANIDLHLDTLARLERNFRSRNQLVLANLAYYEQRQLEELQSTGGEWVFRNFILDGLFGYGVKPENALITSFIFIIVFAIIYFLKNVAWLFEVDQTKKRKLITLRLGELPIMMQSSVDQKHHSFGTKLMRSLLFSVAVFTRIQVGGWEITIPQSWNLLKFFIILEWILGTIMLAGLVYSILNTIPLLQLFQSVF